MINMDFFACTETQIRTCSWVEAAEGFPATSIRSPDTAALTVLSRLLTGDERFPASRLDIDEETKFRLDPGFTTALEGCSDDEVSDLAVRWASEPVWNDEDINPMDLGGVLLGLRALLRGLDAARQAVFLWVESE